MSRCIREATFSDLLKRAEVTPVFKKDDPTKKSNYRPVSVLPYFSKIFESVILDKMHEIFNRVASPYLSGFRRNHSCQSILTCLVQNSRDALDADRIYGILITDLSKALDCLPHRLLIAKLKAYDLDETACKWVSYFTGKDAVVAAVVVVAVVVVSIELSMWLIGLGFV